MTKIDETTGLAQLPEDMFWRIEEANLKFGYTTVDTLRLMLMQKRTVTTAGYTTSLTEEILNGFWKHFLTGEKYETVTTETVIPAKTEEVQNNCITRTLASKAKLPYDTRGWTKYTVQNYYSDEEKTGYFKVDEPTKENLKALSVEVLTDWINNRHEVAIGYDKKHIRDKIIGDYPPKSLKDMETV